MKLFLIAAMLATMLASRWPIGDGIHDCSRRGLPQYRDTEGRWTCR